MAQKKESIFDVNLFKRLLKYIKPYKGLFIFLLFVVVCIVVFNVAFPKVLQQTIDENLANGERSGFMLYIFILGALLLLQAISQLVFIYYTNFLGQSVVKDIRIKLFDHILRLKMTYYNNSSVGVLITRTVTDIERISEVFSQGLFMISSEIFTMLGLLVLMLYMNWKLSIVVLLIMPLILYATKIFQKYMKKAFEEVRNEVSNLNSFVQERIAGMKILQLFSREEIEYKKFEAINERHKKGWIKTVWYNSIFFPIAELLTSITLGIVIWYGGLNLVLEQTATLGDLIAFTTIIPKLYRPLRNIADKFSTLQMGLVAANRVFKVLDTNAKVEDTSTLDTKEMLGNIEFKNVYFSYVKKEPVLKGISFSVAQGETVAIVGATGAGKSTIINLLGRLYEIDRGIISIDKINITDMKLSSLRKKVAVVLQDVFLFADTILNNITLNSPEITEKDVELAAKQIGIHEFVMSLPNGYHYNVKERGAMLSSGQRQLISFLRAYVTNPSVLILDEATSSVDSYSEQLIQEATDKITKGRTSIIIAHRLATIQKADTILVMDSGKIVEQGSHKELLKKTDGYYRNLYEVQFMKEELA